MKTFPHGITRGLIASALLLTHTLSAQSQWSDLGSGLAGGTGIPALSGSGELTPGSANTVTLQGAAPSALSLLFLGLENNAVPFKGGVLKPVPNIPLPVTMTSALGQQALPFAWPNDLPGSLPFYLQFAVQDGGAPNGVALSNALRGVSAGSLPVIDDIFPAVVPQGGTLSIEGVNLGSDPLDVLTQLVLPGDVVVGYMTTEGISGNTATARIDGLVPGTTTAQVAVGTGEGSLFVPASLPPGISLPEGGARLWRGLPSDIQVSDTFITLGSSDPGEPTNCTDYPGTVTSLQWLEVQIPALVCTPGSKVTFVMVVYTTAGVYCTTFSATLTNVGDGDAQDCASAIADMITSSFFGAYGLVILPQILINDGDAVIRLPPPLGESWVIGSSKSHLTLCLPDIAGCETVTGAVDGQTAYINVSMPANIPDSATVSYSFDASLSSGPVFSVAGVLPFSGAVTGSGVAAAIAADLGSKLPNYVVVASVGGSVQVQPPFLNFWNLNTFSVEICD